MNCREMNTKLADLLLDPHSATSESLRHLEECGDCRDELAEPPDRHLVLVERERARLWLLWIIGVAWSRVRFSMRSCWRGCGPSRMLHQQGSLLDGRRGINMAANIGCSR